jgi:putative SOS response-associated peptidase YedK
MVPDPFGQSLIASYQRSHARGSLCQIAPIMPVMLAKDGFARWLSGSEPAVDPGLDAAVEIRLVSPKMNSPKYNEPDCIEPLVTSNGPAAGTR